MKERLKFFHGPVLCKRVECKGKDASFFPRENDPLWIAPYLDGRCGSRTRRFPPAGRIDCLRHVFRSGGGMLFCSGDNHASRRIGFGSFRSGGDLPDAASPSPPSWTCWISSIRPFRADRRGMVLRTAAGVCCGIFEISPKEKPEFSLPWGTIVLGHGFHGKPVRPQKEDLALFGPKSSFHLQLQFVCTLSVGWSSRILH